MMYTGDFNTNNGFKIKLHLILLQWLLPVEAGIIIFILQFNDHG